LESEQLFRSRYKSRIGISGHWKLSFSRR